MAQERERENKIERKEFTTRKRERKVWMEKKWWWWPQDPRACT